MRFSVVNLIGAILIVFYNLAFAAPQTVSFQGVLRTAAGAPVPDASYDATFSLYDTPTGGVPIWTETQPVTTTGGLFTCELGAFVDLLDSYVHQIDDGVRYLQIQVVINGTPVIMSPRTHLANAPSALTASSINGTRTGSTTGTIRMQMTNDSTHSSLDWDNNNDGTPESSIKQKSGSSGSSSVLHGMSGSTTGTIRMMATGDSVVELSAIDDGASSYKYLNNENCMWTVQCPSMSGSTTGTIRMTATPDSIVESSSVDNGSSSTSSRFYRDNEQCEWSFQCPTGFSSVTTSSSGTGHILSGHMGSTTGTIRMMATGDSVVEESGMENGASSKQYYNNEHCVWNISCPSMTGSTTGTIRMEATGDSAGLSVQQGAEVPGNHRDGWNVICVDGISEITGHASSGLPPGDPIIDNMRLRVDALSSSVAINTKGTGADKGRSASSTVDELGARTILTTYDDSDPNVALTEVSQSCDDTTASLRILSLNGLPPGVPVEDNIAFSTNGTSSRLAIKTKGTSAHRSSSTTYVSGDSAVTTTSIDVDDDGDDDGGVQCRSIESRTILETFFETGDIPTAERSVITHTADASGSSTEMSTRLNGLPPGEPVIGTLSLTTTNIGAGIAIGDPGTNEFRTSSSDGSTLVSTSNRFGSGPRQTTSMDGSYDHARMECATDVDNDGTPDVGTQAEAKVPRAVLKSYYQTADKPTQSQFITVADSSGTNTEMSTRLNGLPPGEPVIGTLSMTTSSSSASLAMGNPENKNIGLYVSSTTGQCMMTMMDDGGGVGSTPETTIVIDAHTKRFGIGVSQPSHPIDHSSGAKLTTAGDWVNASSEKLKENFEAVNGAEVLEKIEDLSVTRWNYKADDDNITHIGPTAEEFHDAFGIGESDKAISTIDPSGVALVAIKELSKRNKQLEKQNEQLQKQLQDLQKAVDKLVKQAEKSR